MRHPIAAPTRAPVSVDRLMGCGSGVEVEVFVGTGGADVLPVGSVGFGLSEDGGLVGEIWFEVSGGLAVASANVTKTF